MRIVEALRHYALTPLGLARLAELQPHAHFRQVEASLALTTEGVRYLAANPHFPLEAPADLETLLVGLAVEGRPLEPPQLRGLAAFLATVEQVCGSIRRARAQYPLLAGVAETASSFEREVADVRRQINAAGEVVDEASPALRGIRDRLRKQRARLRGTLESYLRSRETARYLQDQIVTDRNGRYVLVVRAEHRGAIPGIVHGTSASGASLFLEPLSTVEVNNEIVALEEQEAEEVRRILLALTDAFRRRATDLQRTLESATELDVVQAKARFAQTVGGVEPQLGVDGRFELRAARHPLLIPAVAAILQTSADDAEQPAAAPATEPVPNDILLAPPASVLVISGPNTGGKTVALKCAGLLALMAQAGLHVPAAAGTRLPVFRSIFADIGDEQSIAASLSTFSWHMTNIAAMERALALPALVLLDEIGAGTDPVEGGALGVAVIEHLRRRGAHVVVTTHQDQVKSYASTSDGVVCAAFGFEPETFAPTYRLVYGSPGRSLALEVAARLGLPASVIEAARAHRGERETLLADHLSQIERDRAALEHERRRVAREREALADLSSQITRREEALSDREDVFTRRLDARLNERLRQAREEIDRVVEDLKRRAAALAAEATRRAERPATGPIISTGETGGVRAEARAALDSLARRFREVDGDGRRTPAESEPVAGDVVPAVGDRVAVGGLGLEGTVQTISDREADVDVRGKRLRVRVDELRVVGPTKGSSRVSVSVQLQPRDGLESDLNVIGCTADEAVARTEKFLDQALLSEQRTVRVIHGHGTGQLRRALTRYLQEHPLVERISAAPAEQGGGGVTVIELKE